MHAATAVWPGGRGLPSSVMCKGVLASYVRVELVALQYFNWHAAIESMFRVTN